MESPKKRKSQEEDLPKILYAVFVNLAGLTGPLRCRIKKEIWSDEEFAWWDSTGEWDVKGTGLIVQDNYITFASTNKDEAEIFALGVKSAHNILFEQLAYSKFTLKENKKYRA